MLEAKVIRECTPAEIQELPTWFLSRIAINLVAQAILNTPTPADRSAAWDANAHDVGTLNRYLLDGDNDLAARSTALRWITD